MKEADLYTIENSFEQTEKHAARRADFNEYGSNMMVSKQVLLDMVTQYKMFFSVDKKSEEFLEKVRKYAELDPSSSDNYDSEKEFVKDFSKYAEQMDKYLDRQEEEFQKDVDAIDMDAYNKMSDNEKQMFDYKFIMRQEAIDNRKRAVASFYMYFQTLKDGDMTDLEKMDDKIKERINEANNKKGLSTTIFKINNNQQCYYINSAGVSYDKSAQKEKWYILAFSAVGNATGFEKDMRNEPLFRHEPCMSDVSQGYTGDCYIMAALQNVARLYPQKIRDMIKDNGDGTATVRLYARKREDDRTKYYPVYVRVDKTIPKIGLGLFDKLAEDCLWVNMIEKAYMMSGLHATYDKNQNLPIKYNEKKNEGFVPAINGIEGGDSGLFTETLLGPLGAHETVAIPTAIDLMLEADKYKSLIEKRDDLKKHVDLDKNETIVKHAMFSLYKLLRNNPDEEKFQKLNEDEIVDAVVETSGGMLNNLRNMPKRSEEYIKERCRDTYKCMMKLVEYEKAKNEGVFPTIKPLSHTFKDAFKKIAVIEQYAKVLGKEVTYDRHFSDIIRDLKIEFFNKYSVEEQKSLEKEIQLKCDFTKKIFEMTHDALAETTMVNEVYDVMPKREKMFMAIKEALDTGMLVSCGTRASDVKYNDEKHAYSLIGAYKTKDEPPKYYIRVNNPNKATFFSNGIKYKEENGELVVKRAVVGDGIYDISIEDFANDFELLDINGTPELAFEYSLNEDNKNIMLEEDRIKYDKENMTIDKLTDIMKVTNDLYESMLATNSCFSKDSDPYKDLLEGIKIFRQGLAMSNGKKMDKIKNLSNSLLILVEHYETHLGEDATKYSKRQKARFSVCQQIRKFVDCINDNKNPLVEFEKDYAKKLYEQYLKQNKYKKGADFDEVSQKLYTNKAFRNIANKTSVVAMANADKKQMKEHLTKMEKLLTGRDVVRGDGLKALKPKADNAIAK